MKGDGNRWRSYNVLTLRIRFVYKIFSNIIGIDILIINCKKNIQGLNKLTMKNDLVPIINLGAL